MIFGWKRERKKAGGKGRYWRDYFQLMSLCICSRNEEWVAWSFSESGTFHLLVIDFWCLIFDFWFLIFFFPFLRPDSCMLHVVVESLRGVSRLKLGHGSRRNLLYSTLKYLGAGYRYCFGEGELKDYKLRQLTQTKNPSFSWRCWWGEMVEVDTKINLPLVKTVITDPIIQISSLLPRTLACLPAFVLVCWSSHPSHFIL